MLEAFFAELEMESPDEEEEEEEEGKVSKTSIMYISLQFFPELHFQNGF